MTQWLKVWLAYYPRAYAVGLLALFLGAGAAFLSVVVVAVPLLLLSELIGSPMSQTAALAWGAVIALPACLGALLHLAVGQGRLFPDRSPPSWSDWKLGIRPRGRV